MIKSRKILAEQGRGNEVSGYGAVRKEGHKKAFERCSSIADYKNAREWGKKSAFDTKV
jgi:hypothetical protein